MDTIYAEATPPGRGGVSVVRVSGPRAHELLGALAGPCPAPRRLTRRLLCDAGDPIDDAMVVCFRAGASFTGEDSAEFHLHGAPAVVARLGTALHHRGARLAEPGEFTRRAFANGRLDLTEIEGLGDLLQAETEAQRQQAMRVASGELRDLARSWRQRLVEAGAMLTAEIDFPDEDVPEQRDPRVSVLLERTRQEIGAVLAGAGPARQLRRGFEVAIVGEPNVGKSSLLNCIAQRAVALVSDVPGTTRDVIEFRADLDGLPVTFLDTAGLREAEDRVEAMGVAAARARAAAADLRIHVVSGGAASALCVQGGDIVVQSKGDLPGSAAGAVSAVTGAGIYALLVDVAAVLRGRIGTGGLAAHERQAQALGKARDALLVDTTAPAELVSEHVRMASLALAQLLGVIAVDDYLDMVFSRFCIGK